MSDELREKVAMKRKIMSLIVDTWDGERLIDNAADAAIALVRAETLEEAAKVAEKTIAYSTSEAIQREKCVAAIRAMKGKPPTG